MGRCEEMEASNDQAAKEEPSEIPVDLTTESSRVQEGPSNTLPQEVGQTRQLSLNTSMHIRSSMPGSTIKGSPPSSATFNSDDETFASSTDASPSLTSKLVHLPPISRVLCTDTSVRNKLNCIQCDTFDTNLEIHHINVGSLEENPEARIPLNQLMDPFESSAGIIKRIAKPEYPIRVYGGPPTSITEEAQRRIFRWRYTLFNHNPMCVWLVEPNIAHLKEIVAPYLQRIVPESEDFEIEYLTQGGFNKVYTAFTVGIAPKTAFIIRVALPTDPYYRVESDVATTELVRCSTGVPVPIIYAYQSSQDNKLGLEWMIMEKINGKELHNAWLDWDYEAKLRLTKTMALWTSQLLRITSDKVGSVYMRWAEEHVDFYIGRSVHCFVSGERHLWYDVPRGPYGNLEEWLSAWLAIHKAHAQDCMNKALQDESGAHTIRNGLLSTPSSDDSLKDQRLQSTEKVDQGSIETTAEEALYAQAERDDANYFNWEGYTAQHFQQRIQKCDFLTDALPQLCIRAVEEMPQLSTKLMHRDISVNNIFIDDKGSPIALIDWEHTPMEPSMCIDLLPDFLDTQSTDELPEPDERDPEYRSRLLARGWTEEKVNEDEAYGKKKYLERLDNFHCTKLRLEFKKELDKLVPMSSLSSRPDSDSFLQELWSHINDVEDTVTYGDWLRKYIDYDSEEDEDGEGEDITMADT